METTTASPLLIPGLPAGLVRVPSSADGAGWRDPWWEWHTDVKAAREALAFRLAQEPDGWPEEIENCKNFGPKYTAAMHLSVWEPRGGQAFGDGAVPAIPLPHQIRVMDFAAARFLAHDRLVGLIKKPRKVGVTWGVIFDSFWRWRWQTPWEEAWVSKNEKQVDKSIGNKGTIFGKFDAIIQFAPNPLLPAKFQNYDPNNRRKMRGVRSFLSIVNPETGAVESGFATTISATRGDRLSRIDIDEASFIRGLIETLATAIGASDCVLAFSSASDEVSRDWAQIEESTLATNPAAVLKIIEDEHPAWTPEWHETEKSRYYALGDAGKDAYEREMMQQGGAGLSVFIYPEARDVPFTGQPIDPSKEVLASLDPGLDDEFAISIWQERRPSDWLFREEPDWPVDLVWGWQSRQRDAGFIASLLVGKPQFTAYPGIYDEAAIAFAAVMARLKDVTFYGDPDGDAKKGPTGESWFAALRRIGAELSDGARTIYVQTNYTNRGRHLPGRRDALRRGLRRTRCLDHPVARDVLHLISENRYQERSRTRPGISEAWHDQHDETAHYTATAEYLFVHLEGKDAVEAPLAAAKQGRTGSYASPHGVNRVPQVPVMARGW